MESLATRNGRRFAFSLERGECLGVSGPSGSGKTLLLRAIADLDPHEGEVYLEGIPKSLVPPPAWRKRVGLLPAESAWWGRRVGEHFARPHPALAQLGLSEEVMGWPVDRLSSGERQRLALARLLANAPQVLLLDEPAAHLDEEGACRVEAAVREFLARGGAVIWVDHDQRRLGRVAHRELRL